MKFKSCWSRKHFLLQLTKSSSLSVGLGIAEVSPAFRFVAAMVLIEISDNIENAVVRSEDENETKVYKQNTKVGKHMK